MSLNTAQSLLDHHKLLLNSQFQVQAEISVQHFPGGAAGMFDSAAGRTLTEGDGSPNLLLISQSGNPGHTPVKLVLTNPSRGAPLECGGFCFTELNYTPSPRLSPPQLTSGTSPRPTKCKIGCSGDWTSQSNLI